MSTQQPSVGRIVHYQPNEQEHQGHPGYPHAAIITRVWSFECVNLTIFGPQETYSKTSVLLGQNQTNWNWPPRF